MERPQGVFGLARHYVELRWKALSPRGRMFALAGVVATGLALGGVAHAALGGCHGACSAHRAPVADSGCPHAAH